MSYSSVVLADSPIRYYRLDETSGTLAHDLGSQGQNGTIIGGVTLSQQGLLKSDSDASMLFTGGYISLPTTGLPTGAGAWSLECWIRVSSSPSSYESAMAFGTRLANQSADIWFDPSGTVHVGFDGGGDVQGPVVTPNVPHHIVGTYTGSTLSLYYDGVLIGSIATPSAIVAGVATIGDTTSPGDLPFSGVIDEGAFYGSALSAGRVLAHYQAGISKYASIILADTPLRYYRLDETSGTTAHDLGSQGQNGTLVGTGLVLAQTGLLSGDPDTCYTWDSTHDSYITCPDAGITSGPWTIEAWVNLTGAGAVGSSNFAEILGIGSFSSSRILYNTGGAGSGSFTTQQGGLYATSNLYTYQARHHVVLTWNGTVESFWIDGVQDSTFTPSTTPTWSGVFQIGSDIGNYCWNGKIDEVTVYSFVLSANQVKSHYLAGLYSLLAQFRSKFSTRLPSMGMGRAKFPTRMTGLVGKARVRFFTRFSLLSSAGRVRFRGASILKSLARALFRTGKHRALRAALRSEIQRLNAIFSEGPMSSPNTTIDVSLTVTDNSNFVVSTLTSCTCTITHSDGSTTGPLTATNLGNGLYTVTYTTRNQGLTRELWSLTDQSGATASFLNVNPVSF